MTKFADIVGTEVPPKAATSRGGLVQVNFEGVSASAPPTPSVPQTSFSGERRWQSDGDHFWNANLTLDTIPSGLYRTAEVSNIGCCLEKIRNDVDHLIEFPDSPSSEVIAEIREFWKLKPQFAQRGFIFKRGVLLWGLPGSGKTSTLQQLITIVVRDHDGIAVFLDHPILAARALQMARRIEPDRPIVALLEDIDALVQRYGESEFLALLDGETQIPNVVFVATTNYPKRLDKRFIDRPSRFDLIKEIGMPSAPARRAYLAAKEPSLSDEEMSEWVRRSDGFSIAHLREMIVLCRCYGKSLDEAVERLEEMREGPPSEGGLGRPVGFAPRRAS